MSRQPDFSTRPAADRTRMWEKVALALAAATLAFVLLSAWRARSEAGQARARLAAVQEEAERHASRVRSLSPLDPYGTSAAGAAASPARIVAGVASVLPAAVRLGRLAVDYRLHVSLEMEVIARDAAGWDRLLDALERSPQFSEVEPGPESREGEVRSVVRARFGEAKP